MIGGATAGVRGRRGLDEPGDRRVAALLGESARVGERDRVGLSGGERRAYRVEFLARIAGIQHADRSLGAVLEQIQRDVETAARAARSRSGRDP